MRVDGPKRATRRYVPDANFTIVASREKRNEACRVQGHARDTVHVTGHSADKRFREDAIEFRGIDGSGEFSRLFERVERRSWVAVNLHQLRFARSGVLLLATADCLDLHRAHTHTR